MTDIIIGYGKNHVKSTLLLQMANRHGLIAGATGTGKTITLQSLIEQFSLNGIPVFTADIKGDLSGISKAEINNEKIKERLTQFKIDLTPLSFSVNFWDLNGKNGMPLRTTISEFGPLLLGRLFNCNDTQQGILNAAFSYADKENLLLIDLKDLQSLLNWMSDNAKVLKSEYGNISSSSIGTLQRSLLTLKESGGDKFFGEPSLDLNDFLQCDNRGFGYINILDATTLINDSRIYSTFLLWLLSELFEKLPEVGDLEKPKCVFFFDEAHLLFNSAPKLLLEKIEQVVRLIRSKGIGVYFITQNPLDIPESVLGQLSNRIQHALRAFTPKDKKSVKVAAQTFRQNPKINTEESITILSVGDALVSTLDKNGMPTEVEIVNVMPPRSYVGAITDSERNAIIEKSNLYQKYQQSFDRESAYEKLQKQPEKFIEFPEEKSTGEKQNIPKKSPGRKPDSVTDIFVKSTTRSLGNKLGREIIRGVLGSIFKKG